MDEASCIEPYDETHKADRAALLGYMRGLDRGITLDEQAQILAGAGVTAKFVYEDVKSPKRDKGARRMFAEALLAIRRGDVLVVPSLGIFGRNRREVIDGMAALELRGVALWSVLDQIDTRHPDPDQLFRLASAIQRAENCWKSNRTVSATTARRGGKTGPRPKLSPKREHEAMLAWTDPENMKRNKEIAEEFGLSPGRLYAKFGRRPVPEA